MYKRALYLYELLSFSFIVICSLGKNCIDLFRKLKHDSHEFIILSSSNMFFIPKTKCARAQPISQRVDAGQLNIPPQQ